MATSAGIPAVKCKMDLQYFLTHDPPAPHRGWNPPAFQDYCRTRLGHCGFDLERAIHVNYNRKTRVVTFWQEFAEVDLDPALVIEKGLRNERIR